MEAGRSAYKLYHCIDQLYKLQCGRKCAHAQNESIHRLCSVLIDNQKSLLIIDLDRLIIVTAFIDSYNCQKDAYLQRVHSVET